MSRAIRGGLAAFVLAALITCLGATAAYAGNGADVDLDAKGSITATLTADSGTPADGELTLYQAATLKVTADDMVYAYTSDFDGCTASLADPADTALPAELASWVSEHSLTGTAATIGSDGKVTFPDLSVGLYLICQTTSSTGFNDINPFVVTVPLDVDGTWVYDVDASPKVEPMTATPNTDNPPDSDNPPDTGKGGGGGGNGGGSGGGGNGGGSGGGNGGGSGGSGSGGSGSGSTLPQTGQLVWPIPVLFAAGLILIVVGLVLMRRKKHGAHAA